MTTTTSRPGRARSLRGATRSALIGLAAVILLCVLGGGVSMASLLSNRSTLSDELEPAATSGANLLARAYSQQNAVRGYALAKDETFLEPYRQAAAEADQLIQRLRDLLEDRPATLGLLERGEAELARWQQESGVPLIEAAGRTTTDAEMRALVLRSRMQFDQARDTIRELNDDIGAEAAAARADYDAASDRLLLTLVLATTALAASVVAMWVAVRRAVLEPLSELVDDAERISNGELELVPRESGPDELVELSRSVDEMRSALVAQLRAVEAREADLARSNAELEQFAYVASHDLQEPLRKVASFCQMLERRYSGQLDERADQYIAFAVDGAKRMQVLINDLLAFSRVGRTTESFVPVDLGDALDRALRNLSTAISDSNATVEHDPLPTVDGDRTLLSALFQNLIGNAIKFRRAETPAIRITARPLDTHVEIAVSDNGIGIPDEYRDRVFVIFQRLHGRAEYAGTGIGLALCRKIVEFHGGRIEIDPPGDRPGTTIRFTLQVEHTETTPSAVGPPVASNPEELASR